MGRISTPAVASSWPRRRLFTSWLQRWRQPLPLVGLDVGELGMCWVELSTDPAGLVRVVTALVEPLPPGWGQPDDVRSWDLGFLGDALARLKAQRLKARPTANDAMPRYLAMGLSAQDVQCARLAPGLTERQQLAHIQAQMLRSEACWDVAQGEDGAQLISTPRAVVLTLQALAESAGLELAVLETSEAARLRADQWRHQQVNTQDHQAGPDVAAQELHHHVTTTALGLALRRFLPWGTAC